MRLHGLLASLGPGRRPGSPRSAAQEGGVGGAGLMGSAIARSYRRGGEASSVGGGGEEEERGNIGVFRASQEQQALMFSGKRVAVATGRGSATGSGGFHTFAYNNHRR